ncbi:AarF/UbiB family protein [Streptomyces sp. 11-1-2]|uniref:ABC1 kinase family protein n=1 Tax=unclassified Streptomyces TaxID=2593676 RepID=UPI000B8D50FD|nr:AarF/UbiB family protein [Streptomyces sp. 11-1-2]ASQ97433.1 hypothetical protein CGL27_34320 [Streptomyces sp. 11-1-2]
MKLAQFLLALLVMTAFIMAFVFSARRLLGLRIGIVRSLLAGLVSVVGLAVFSLLMQRPEQRGILTGVQFGSTLVVTTGFLAVLEVVLPSGSVGGPRGWVRSARSRVTRTRRYWHIVSIAVRHGLRPSRYGAVPTGGRGPGSGRMARPLRLALEEGGATFVKLGQVLSTRRDLLPPAFIAELGRLHHQVSPEPWQVVGEALERELGMPLTEAFAHFDHVPLAAASIAQVHAARLHSGEEVVVKVRRPGVREVAECDLQIILRFARTLERRAGWARALGVVDLADGFATSVREELDFRIEAANIATVSTAWSLRSEGTGIRLPRVYEEWSGEQVLVMERLTGTPIGSAAAVLKGTAEERLALARKVMVNMFHQVMIDGTFHADPHPGNILLLDDGAIGVIDFGSVGRVDAQVRSGLRSLLFALNSQDSAALCDALLEVVTRPEEIDEQRLQRELGRFLSRYFAPGSTPSVQIFTDLFRLVQRHGLTIPPEVAAVFRALGTLEGTLMLIAPGFVMVEEARTFADGGFARAGGDPLSQLISPTDVMAAWELLRRLPRRLDRVTSALEQGRLGVGVRLFANARDRTYIRSLVHEILLTFIAATSGVMSVILLSIDGGPLVVPGIGLFQLLGYHLLVISGVIGLKVLFLISRGSGRN